MIFIIGPTVVFHFTETTWVDNNFKLIFFFKPRTKGRLFATYSLESLPVSVSLSPTSKHLMVGYSMRGPGPRLAPYSPSDRSLIAQIFRLKMPWECMTSTEQEQPPRGRLVHRRDLHQNEPGQTFLNCIRWIPVSGLGMVYATNTGLLKILR